MPTINPDKYFKDLFARTEDYAGKVQQIYGSAITQLIELGASVKIKEGDTFSFDSNKGIQVKAANILKSMNSHVYEVIQGGVKAEWGKANERNDQLVEDIFGKGAFEQNVFAKYFDHNEKAMNAFMDRASGGLGLSKKVWNYTGKLKTELETALDIGIGEGGSASKISKTVRSYLKEPDKLFKRVQITSKDADGNITKTGKYKLSKAAEAYHPGQGVYRSSYKNAMRLTRTETNMAYHASDHERWQQFDFVVGYEVKLSNNHPVTDICNDFAGKYPKTFKFVGWHPQCRCFAVAIFCTDDELTQLTDNILNGDEIQDFTSVNHVTSLPKGYSDWIEANKERVATAKSIPYFIKNNYVSGDLSKGLIFDAASVTVGVPPILPVPLAKISKSYIPAELDKGSDYTKGTSIEFSNEFFSLMDPNKPVGLVIDKKLQNSYYNPGANSIHIANGSRRASEWHREGVIYHEYGHAIDWQRDLRNGSEVQKLMGKYRKILSKKQSRTYSVRGYDYSTGMYVNKSITVNVSDYAHIDTQLINIDRKIHRMKPETFQKLGVSKDDVEEQILSVRDAIMSLNSAFGGGHSKAYFKRSGMKEAEFIAHCFENTFAGNRVFKKYLSDLYDEMVSYIKALK